MVCDCVNHSNNNDVCWRLGSVTCIASNYLGIHCRTNAGRMVMMTESSENQEHLIGNVGGLYI